MKSVLFFVAVFSLPVSEAADGGEARPFERVDQRMVSSSVTAFGDPGRTVEYVYENVGDRVITAWEHRCIKATNDGRVGWSSSSRDGFRAAILPRSPSYRRSQLVYPGDTVRTEVGFADDDDGPFAAVSCGMVLAIFEDGSYRGAPEIATPHFARRRAMTLDARRLVDELERIEASGEPSEPLQPERFGIYSERVHSILEGAPDGRSPLKEMKALRQQAENDLEVMVRHLRPVDREMIRELGQ